jgi:hypothetical protein
MTNIPDLVERLRAGPCSGDPVCEEAADEIERLRAEIAEWQKVADASTPEAFRLQMKADGERDD